MLMFDILINTPFMLRHHALPSNAFSLNFRGAVDFTTREKWREVLFNFKLKELNMDELLDGLLDHIPYRALEALGRERATHMAENLLWLLFPDKRTGDAALRKMVFTLDGGGSGRGELKMIGKCILQPNFSQTISVRRIWKTNLRKKRGGITVPANMP